uniref:hypothetical protein n=1 Tax=Gonatophragmium mori TaxID=2966219 RepID=UPI0023D8B617|nr:hypothetical protein P2Z26_mgp35 [Gonatophragmium mori]WCZ71145.1 hypothetical protein [Gonatophragmium mori]
MFISESEKVESNKGKWDNKEMTLYEVKILFLKLKQNYIPNNGSDKEFCMLANGFWQAEGYIGGIFRSGFNFYPLCTATQLFSKESAYFFIRLNNALDNKGIFNITINNFGKFVIHYRLSGWDTFLNVFIPYFYMLYGAKYQAILKLKKIFELKTNLKDSDELIKVLLISIAYSLTPHKSRYKLDLKEKLISLNLDTNLLKKLPQFNYGDNKVHPSFLFILGFFLGDGTLHLKLEWKDKNSTIVIIPLFNIIQSNVESNRIIMEIITNYLVGIGIKASLWESSTIISVTVKGIDNIFKGLLPFFIKYSYFLYWKKDSFNLLTWTHRLINDGGHHTYLGLNLLINKIYYSVNERFTDKEVWIERLNNWLKKASSRRVSGELYISPIYKSNKEIRGWQVRFPSTLKIPKSNKAFMFSTLGGEDKALYSAIKYRDNIISDWINTYK